MFDFGNLVLNWVNFIELNQGLIEWLGAILKYDARISKENVFVAEI